jgi:hypothetical protein
MITVHIIKHLKSNAIVFHKEDINGSSYIDSDPVTLDNIDANDLSLNLTAALNLIIGANLE